MLCGAKLLMGVWLMQAPASLSPCRRCRRACTSMQAGPRRRPAARRPAACSMARPAGSGAVLAGLPAWLPRHTRSDAVATWGRARCGCLHAPPRRGCVPAPHQRGRSLRMRMPAPSVPHAVSLQVWAALQRCCAAQVPYSDLSDISENEEDNANDAYVWGTNVAIARVCKRARRFYTTFTEPGTDEPKYMAIIRQARCSLCECYVRRQRQAATTLQGAVSL